MRGRRGGKGEEKGRRGGEGKRIELTCAINLFDNFLQSTEHVELPEPPELLLGLLQSTLNIPTMGGSFLSENLFFSLFAPEFISTFKLIFKYTQKKCRENKRRRTRRSNQSELE